MLLHFFIAVALLIQGHRRKPCTPADHPLIVDFIKIGAKSTAPILSPQGDATTKMNVPAAPAPTAKSIKNERPADSSAAKGKDELQKSFPISPSKKRAEENKISTNISKKKITTNVDKSTPVAKKTVPANEKKQIGPKSEKQAATKAGTTAPKKNSKGASRAKMNLANKGSAQSVNDFLGTTGGGAKGAAMAESLGDVLTGTDVDRLNQHMKRFWNMPSGHEKASQIVVEVRLSIDANGRVEKATIVDAKRYRNDSDFRIAAECALRAVMDPECSPLPLPLDKYTVWKDMIFEFNPNEMCR